MARQEQPGEGISQNNLARVIYNPLTGGIETYVGGVLTDLGGGGTTSSVASLDVSLLSALPSGFNLTRASTSTYLDSDGVIKTAASGSPVFEYDATGNALGLRVEKACTNSCLYSGDLSNAAWVKNQITYTAGQADPMGGVTAHMLTETSGTAYHKQTVAISAGKVVTYSQFVKYVDSPWVRLTLAQTGTQGNRVTAWFNVLTGQVGSIRANDTAAGTVMPTTMGSKLVPIGNGFYQCFVWGVIPGATSIECTSFTASVDTKQYNATSPASRIQTGGQIVVSDEPDVSSYIPTTTAAATRAADSVTATVVGYRVGGALVIGYQRNSPISETYNVCVAQLDDGTGSNSVTIADCWDATAGRYVQRLESIISGSAAQTANLSPIGKAATTLLVSSANYASLVANGGRASQDYAIAAPAAKLTRLTIGATAAGARKMSGYISSVKYIPSRVGASDASTLTANPSLTPVAENATAEAKSLYRYLHAQEKQFLFGIEWKSERDLGGLWQLGETTNYPTGGNEQVISRLLTQSGYADDTPVITGISDQEWCPTGQRPGGFFTHDLTRTDITNKVKDWFRAGRIVTMCTDMPNFVGPTATYPSHVSIYAGGKKETTLGTPSTTNGEDTTMCMRRIQPGGDLNYKLTDYLNSLCNLLNMLEVDGIKIPIILRLFRESRMGAFWWNVFDTAPDGAQYVPDSVYIATYRYAAQYIKSRCPQVLFNFCMGCLSVTDLPNGSSDGMNQDWYTAVYPGHDVTDCVTCDPYNNSISPAGDLQNVWMVRSIDAAKYLADQGGKVFAYSEIGFYWSAQNWVAATATAKSMTTTTGWANPSSFWDGVVLEQIKRRGDMPSWIMWWGEGGAPYYGCPASASAVAWLRSPECVLGSKVTRQEIYNF